MKKVFTSVLAAMLVNAPVLAQVTTLEAPNPAPLGSGQDLDKIVCEVRQPTGTRLGARKVCKTVLEWQQQRSEQREGVESFQRQGTSVGCQEGQVC